ncbi:unannotated protein [freshwater metagenome]|uniref:Unannotated protein n=1 Tax=freshwater metagenome TaxID=449393 RepID=A0A6J6DKA9_9ZZZZ
MENGKAARVFEVDGDRLFAPVGGEGDVCRMPEHVIDGVHLYDGRTEIREQLRAEWSSDGQSEVEYQNSFEWTLEYFRHAGLCTCERNIEFGEKFIGVLTNGWGWSLHLSWRLRHPVNKTDMTNGSNFGVIDGANDSFVD